MKKLNILIVCEHASSQFGGEAMLPLNYFLLLSKMQHDVFLITHSRVKPHLENNNDIIQEHIFYIPDTWLHQFLYKISCKLPDRVSVVTTGVVMHFVTQIYQWKLAKKVIKLKKIDIVHEPAPVSPAQPSMMFGLGVPVVIGPMNGGMAFPPAFQAMASRFENMLYALVRFFSSLYNLLIPGKFLADVVLVANIRTQKALPKFRLGQVIELVENGIFSVVEKRPEQLIKHTLKVLYVGRLVDWKKIDILIDAFNACKSQNIELVIVGDGVLKHDLENYAINSPLNKKITFTGAVSHAEINEIYDTADIFVLPSIRECGGAVVLEAMSRGLAVIATNWGGPADYLAEGTGILVEPRSREYLVQAFAKNIDLFAMDDQLRQQMGLAAIKHVSMHFLWQKKVEAVTTIYESLLKDKT